MDYETYAAINNVVNFVMNNTTEQDGIRNDAHILTSFALDHKSEFEQ